jgi:hypothetical protein
VDERLGGNVQAARSRKARAVRRCALIVEAVAQPARPAAPISPDQLMRDIAEIERVRDALAAQPAPVFAKGSHAGFDPGSRRTTDAVPVVIGGVLALVMLTVFGAAAAMTKLARIRAAKRQAALAVSRAPLRLTFHSCI